MKFIVFPDNSTPRKARFVDALITHGAKIHRTFKGRHETPQFLVEADDREAFAVACGTPGRPVHTETAGVARPS